MGRAVFWLSHCSIQNLLCVKAKMNALASLLSFVFFSLTRLFFSTNNSGAALTRKFLDTVVIPPEEHKSIWQKGGDEVMEIPKLYITVEKGVVTDIWYYNADGIACTLNKDVDYFVEYARKRPVRCAVCDRTYPV